MLDVVDSLKQNRESRDWPQIVALLLASILSFSSGTIYAFASPAIPKLLADYNFTIEEASYFPIIPAIAMLIATPLYCRLTDKIGRKFTLLTAGILHIFSWLSIAFARNIYVIYVSRIFFGISDACMFASMPTYIAEVTTPKVRSFYGNIMGISSLVGQFLANCIGFYFSIQSTAFIMLPIPALFIVTFVFMPDSPYYLIMIGKVEEARKSLQKLRGREDVKVELAQITLDVHRQLKESGRFKDLFLIGSNRKALIIANTSRVFQHYSGAGALVVYSQYIFQQAGGDISSGVAAMIVSGIFASVTVFANVICDKLGRRKSMIISCLGCGLVLLAEATYFYLQDYNIVDLKIINWFPILGLTVYAVSSCIGLSVVPTLLVGEIFSTSIRKHANTVTNMIFSSNICLGLKLFQILMSLGMWVPFLFFGLCCLLSSVMSYFIIPETKGKTLEEIQQMLKDGKMS